MSDASSKPSTESTAPQSDAKAAESTTATAEKPTPPPEPPFNVDELLNCTTRFTHKAWYLFYNNRKDMQLIRETPLRATLEARSAAGAEELHKLLADADVNPITRQDKTLSFTATFEQIQTVIKHPQAFMLDAVRL